MDQVKIGKFIAECRKNVNLTQKQLAEKLNITDRAVSKWETGLAMPDSSIMCDLCTILQITADELLHGELAMPTSNRETEETDQKLTQKYSKQLFWLAKSIPLINGFLAVLFSLFTDGARGRIYEVYKFDRYGYIRIRLISFIFGGGTIYSPGNKKIDEFGFLSCVSLFGVIAFICLIVATVFFMISILKKKDRTYVASCILFILSGISVLLLLFIGTPLCGTGWSGWTFEDIRPDFQLGSGTIIWCLLCVLGGTFGLYHHFTTKLGKK